MTISSSRRKRVVIVGCGFAGFSAAQEFGRRYVPRWADVIVIDQSDHQLFTPLLYEAATGAILTQRLRYPIRPDLKRLGIEFRQARVEGVDPAAQTLSLSDGELGYDFLIIGCGSHTNFFNRPDFEANTLPLKTADDADRLRLHIEDCIAMAARARDDAERLRLLTFAIVGAGPTGVELAGSLHQALIARLLPPTSRNPASFRVLLIEARPAILPGVPEPLARAAAAELAASGITVWTESPVDGAAPDGLVIGGRGSVPAGTVVWTAGVQAACLSGLPVEGRGGGGRFRVESTLSLPAAPNIFLIGDMGAAPWNDRPVPNNAPGAIQQGKAAARNVTRRMLDLAPVPFRYEYPGDLLALGYHNAVAYVGGRLVTGYPAWLLRRGVYLTNILGAKNRIGLAGDWLRDEFAGRERTRDRV
ncbi:MAG: NAD(P)/FAD-dependent oxidoreductase [Armatimonadota bacterium]|nr:NAD(P)/FAD-dependent oxidoreductase [Armatimonadota bacterium]